MTTKEFVESIEEAFNEALEIVKLKNKDYSKASDPFSNFRWAEVAGVRLEKAILVRVLDKMARISNCIEKGDVAVKQDAIHNDALDVANYMVILYVYLTKEESARNKNNFTGMDQA